MTGAARPCSSSTPTTPGMKIVRHIETLDESLYGGHLELVFDNCVVPDEAVLGEVDQGFRYAQVRLGPGAHDALHAVAGHRPPRAGHRRRPGRRNARLFGSRLAELGMVQQMIADNEIDIAAARGLILQACWELDQGRFRPRSPPRSPRRSAPRRCGGSWIARCRSAARWVSPATSCSAGSCGRCAPSGSTTVPPRPTAGPSPAASCAATPQSAAAMTADGTTRRRPRPGRAGAILRPACARVPGPAARRAAARRAVEPDLSGSPTGTTRWVLRRPPLGGLTPSAHDCGASTGWCAASRGSDVPVARPVAFGGPEVDRACPSRSSNTSTGR